MSTKRRIRTWLEGIDWLKVVLSIGFLLTAADIFVASVALIRQRPINTLEAVLTASIAVLISVAAVMAWSRSSAERRRRREEERLDAFHRHIELLSEVKAVRRLLEGGSAAANRRQNPRNRPKRKPDGDPGQERNSDEPAGKVPP